MQPTKHFSSGTLAQFLAKVKAQLAVVVELVRTGLSPRARNTLRALLTVDVHSRDIIEKLIEANVTEPSDFSWLSQMRS